MPALSAAPRNIKMTKDKLYDGVSKMTQQALTEAKMTLA